jgi:hypothetical protein
MVALASGAVAQEQPPRLTTSQWGDGERRSLLPRLGSRGSSEDNRASRQIAPVNQRAEMRAAGESDSEPDSADSATLETAKPVTGKPLGPLRRVTRRLTTIGHPAPEPTAEPPLPPRTPPRRDPTASPAPEATPAGMVIQDGTHHPLKASISRMLPPAKGSAPLPPSEAHVAFRLSANRMAEALRARNQEVADQEMEFLRSHTADLRECVAKLPLEKRLKASAISRMYAEGLQLIEDGRASGEESKIRMGFERLDEAHRQMGQLGCDEGE